MSSRMDTESGRHIKRQPIHDTPTDQGDTDPTPLSRRQLLKTGAGAATATIALPTISDVAAAHFHGPDKGTLNIDIKPDRDTNTIHP